MKPRIIKFQTSENEDIYIEVKEDISDYDGGAPIGNTDAIQTASTKFEKALDPLKSIANHLIQKIKQIDAYPEELVIELGLKFSAKAGIILTSVDSEANLKVSLKWIKKPDGK